jgi:hypothetical protein
MKQILLISLILFSINLFAVEQINLKYWEIYTVKKKEYLWSIVRTLVSKTMSDHELNKIVKKIIIYNKKDFPNQLQPGETLFVPIFFDKVRHPALSQTTDVENRKWLAEKSFSFLYQFIPQFTYSYLSRKPNQNLKKASLVSEKNLKLAFSGSIHYENHGLFFELDYSFKKYQNDSQLGFIASRDSLREAKVFYRLKNKALSWGVDFGFVLVEEEYLLPNENGGNALYISRQPGVLLGASSSLNLFEKSMTLNPKLQAKYILSDYIVNIVANSAFKLSSGFDLQITLDNFINPVFRFDYSWSQLSTTLSEEQINEFNIGFGIEF